MELSLKAFFSLELSVKALFSLADSAAVFSEHVASTEALTGLLLAFLGPSFSAKALDS